MDEHKIFSPMRRRGCKTQMLRIDTLAQDRLAFHLTTPFGIFEIPDVLSQVDYAALEREFPPSDRFHHSYDNGRKHYLDNTMPGFFAFLATSPAWKALYRQFSDPAVTDALYALASGFPSVRPAHQRRRWKLVIPPERRNPTRKQAARSPWVWWKSLRARIEGRTAVRIAFEFSCMRDGAFVAPHTDVPPKMISLMLYFPDPGVSYGPDAGTVFYTGKNSNPARPAWEVFMLEPEPAAEFFAGHEVFYRSSFTANRLVGFIKNDISWHGVEPIKLPPDALRRSVNINYFCV